jgi:hypothetical protein
MKKKSSATKRTVAAKRSVKSTARAGRVVKKSPAKQQKKPAMLTKIKHVCVDSAMAFKALMSGETDSTVESDPTKPDQSRRNRPKGAE